MKRIISYGQKPTWAYAPALRLCLVTLLLTLPQVLTAQNTPVGAGPETPAGSYAGQQRRLAAYNVGFNAVVGAVGYTVNRPAGTPVGKALLTGLVRGAAGGTLIYGGKHLAAQMRTGNYAYGWPAKLLHSTGVSLVENAAAGRAPLQVWATEIGPVRLEASRNGVRPRIQPVALGALVAVSTRGKLEIGKSLLLGTGVFSRSTSTPGLTGNASSAFTICNTFVYRTTKEAHAVDIAHEFLHTFQNREYGAVALIAQPVDRRLKNSSGLYRAASKYVYLDVPVFGLAYLYAHRKFIAGTGIYNSNFYEREVKSFAEQRYISPQ